MPIVTGIVETMTDKFGKVNCLLDDGKWYSTKPEYAPSPMPKKGDRIEFDSGANGKYFSKVKILGGAPSPSTPTKATSSAPIQSNTSRTFPVGTLAPERTINRQNALTNAVAYCGLVEGSVTIDQVIEAARKFEAYTTGDLDLEEAKAALKELEG